MALTNSVDQVDVNGREILTYGTADFPIAFFDDDLAVVKVPWHWHDQLEIVIITEGTVHVRIANSDFMLCAGDGYFANSGVLHSATLESKTGHQHALVFEPKIIAHPGDLIWNTYIEPVFGNPLLPFIRLSSAVPWNNDILKLADYAWNQGAYEKRDYPFGVRDSLSGVFRTIMDYKEMLQKESLYTDRYQKDMLRIKKCLAFIEKKFASPVTIEDIAKNADISVSSCLRLFRNVLGTTPIKYLIHYRLQRIAEEFDHLQGATIGEIAFSHGFSDATYFDRCFKKEYGMTPTEYISRQHSKCIEYD
ncbi:MAG: helix-turn-helix transcriptional regulator [Lachnospiraceae bacterium]|nr:helix-turn-helix transcriptional regulator [Lachnospiraceae bacterium]MBQ8328003.1 helix-turn-helix transcriptional regulator [Lachnospiraceae bacterium]